MLYGDYNLWIFSILFLVSSFLLPSASSHLTRTHNLSLSFSSNDLYIHVQFIHPQQWMLVLAKLRCWMEIDLIAPNRMRFTRALFSFDDDFGLVHIEYEQMALFSSVGVIDGALERNSRKIRWTRIRYRIGSCQRQWRRRRRQRRQRCRVNEVNSQRNWWSELMFLILYSYSTMSKFDEISSLSLRCSQFPGSWTIAVAISLCGIVRLSHFTVVAHHVTPFYRVDCLKITPDVKNHLFSFCVGD